MILFLLTLELLLAFFLLALLLGGVLLAPLLVFSFPCFGLLLGFGFACWWHGGWRVGGSLRRDVRVVDGAIGIGANGDDVSDVSAKNDDGGFGVGATRLGIWVVEFAVLVFLQGTLRLPVATVLLTGCLHIVAGPEQMRAPQKEREQAADRPATAPCLE